MFTCGGQDEDRSQESWAGDPSDAERSVAALRSALRDRDLVINEMTHRLKNELQLLASASRRAGRAPGATAASVADLVSRHVGAIGAAHDALYADARQVAALDYLRTLCTPLTGANALVSVRCPADLFLAPEQAGPLGMIAVEAVCNALKYAFSPGSVGVVQVALDQRDDGLVLRITDDGVGLGACANRPGGGMALMRGLARRLGGGLRTFDADPHGTTVELACPAGAAGRAEP